MNQTPCLPGLGAIVAPFKFPASAYEYKIVPLRECPSPDNQYLCDDPQKVEDYWRRHIPADPRFNPEVECFFVLIVNARNKVKGHYLVSTGTADAIHCHAREVFRVAIATSAIAIILTHNHPSGDPSPSEADIKVTRDLLRAGQLLKIQVQDHVILGAPGKRASLRELGYCY